ncbi:MAG: glycoside hydrolase family 25 protein, partial [Actinomycetota bacterium]
MKRARRRTAVVLLLAVALVLPVTAAVADGGPGHAGSSGDADTPGPSRAVAQPAGALPGIDVSHHQDTIDWARVAASGQRFAIAKATEGQTFVDPMYAINQLGAESNGIAFGAYHFAKPDGTANDAQLEADHFVDTALLQPGNLIPVLDIERTGGLTQAE